MQIIMNQYICFIALWCLIMNTYIVFSSSSVKALEQRDKKVMEKIIYFITAAMVLGDLDTYMFAGMNEKWVYLNLEIVNYTMSDGFYNISYEGKRQIFKNKEDFVGSFHSMWNNWHDLHLAAGCQRRVLLFQ